MYENINKDKRMKIIAYIKMEINYLIINHSVKVIIQIINYCIIIMIYRWWNIIILISNLIARNNNNNNNNNNNPRIIFSMLT